ncbi:LOW QUALITY PROTEIN: WD repeat-containing protein on Y chromosome-like [Manis javanica]|uniref:LOW QUALITY PROTEIN: WD repeat-containing protein on Y chromosome-like n=1 Tax=Manis javanica TaxID=9974 RepID=UPI003C6DB5BF
MWVGVAQKWRVPQLEEELTLRRCKIEELQQCLLHSGGPPAAHPEQGAPEGEQRAVLRNNYEKALRAYQAEVEKLRVANEKYTQEWRKKSLEDLKATLNSGPGAQQKENGELKVGMEGIKMEHQLEPGNLRAKRSIETAMHMKEKEGLRQKPQEAQDEVAGLQQHWWAQLEVQAGQPRLKLQEAQDGCCNAELRVHELEKLAVEYRGQAQAIESLKEQISLAKRKMLDYQVLQWAEAQSKQEAERLQEKLLQLLCQDPGQRQEEESQNIHVWDLQDHVRLQFFCGRLFAPGSCPATNAYFHPNDSTLVFSTFSIGILKGYLETQGRGNTGEDHTYSSPLCAILYNTNLKQVVSGCLNGMVNVWETATGRSMVEFSVTRDQHVELTAMSLDESERDLLTRLRDCTVKMWNYSTGECLLTFPNPDQLEISGIIHMNKVFCVTGWSRRITYFMIHKTGPVLLPHHLQTFHREDVLSMATYQSQCLGTSSCSGDILFWNIHTFKPIFGFYASVSALPQSPKEVQEVDECLVESSRPSKPCVGHKRWAYKTPMQPQVPSAKTVANVSLRRNLMSAPPVMRCPRDKEPDDPRDKEPDGPVPLRTVIQENERSTGEFQKMLLQSHPLVEKIIFLQTRPRLPHMAALLSSCMDGYIYAWSIHGNGGLLGKFPVDFEDNGDVVVGAMATDENDWILVTGDCKGHIKIWDIKDYCTFTDKRPFQSSRTNKFRYLIPKQGQISLPYYIPLKEKEVVEKFLLT